MKKSLLALAVLGAFAGAASAQSSVTLYGTVDLSGKYVKNDGSAKRLSMSQDGINSSQLGFRGVEDLGGGLKAGFNLLAGVNPDTGTTNTGAPAVGAAQTSKLFNRRSTVSLFSNAGELRLGRDYNPSFWNQTIYDAFGTNGLGSSLNIAQDYNGTRNDNSIGYFLPGNLGGFYGQAMVAPGEGGTELDKPGRYYGGRLGFAAGPFDVAFAYSQEKMTVNSGLDPAGQTHDTWNVGGVYDFGFLKLMGYYDHEKSVNNTEDRFHPSLLIPMGQGEVHLGYDYGKLKNDTSGVTTKVDQFKATYQYNLSKRTAMYGTAALLKNKDTTSLSVSGGSTITAAPTAGGDSKGFEIGVRHFF
jgi:predicted porin